MVFFITVVAVVVVAVVVVTAVVASVTTQYLNTSIKLNLTAVSNNWNQLFGLVVVTVVVVAVVAVVFIGHTFRPNEL